MTTISVLIDTIEKVKEFVQIVSQYPCEMDLTTRRYTIDAKSIMGIFSLELQSAINLEIHSNSCDDLVEALAPFKVEE